MKCTTVEFKTNLIAFVILILSVSSSSAQPSLKETFKNYYYIGTALNNNQVFEKDEKLISFVQKHFNSITPENSLKWENVHPKPGIYNFEPVDSLVAFCERNKMFIIGHTLVWNQQTPQWVFEDESGNPATREMLLERMKEHILTVVGRYKGKVHGWDVINEGVMENGEMRDSKWFQIIGEDYIQKADPDAELYYNDYNMWYKGKVETVVKLVKDLKSKGVKIDGVGLQGHWGLDYPPIDELDAALKAYSELDVNLMITEFDMDILPNPSKYTGADISTNYELRKELNPFPDSLPDSMHVIQSNRYAEFFNMFNKYKDKISRVTFWGVDDQHSWRNNWPVFGRSAYPLLFDKNLEAKPAFFEVIKTVQENDK